MYLYEKAGLINSWICVLQTKTRQRDFVYYSKRLRYLAASFMASSELGMPVQMVEGNGYLVPGTLKRCLETTYSL